MSEAQRKGYSRFGIFERVEHFVLILSFTTLGLTGLPQKYALNPISQRVIDALGGIETIRIIHHIAAAIFLVEAIYHAVMVFYKLYVRRKQATMVPVVKDATDAIQWFGYNLGINKVRPKMPRYNFMEKAEYWAMLWGLIVMALTGLMLWNPIATTNFLPGEIIPAAKAAHGGEAVLAVLAIILWHFYNVHIKHFNKSMFTGKISNHEMVEEHAAELDQIETGKLPQEPAPAVARSRMMVFVPVALVFTLVFGALTYYFLTFEKTAITTVPPAETAQVFVRATPTAGAPTPTNLPQQSASGQTAVWTGQVETLLKDKCGSCHGSAGGFSAETYDDVMKAVAAGSPDSSKLVDVQKAGNHPGQLSGEELSLVINWIQGGALKDAAGTAGGGAAAEATPTGEAAAAATPAAGETPTAGAAASGGAETWAGGIETLFTDKCGTCHGAAASGGFTVATYDDTLKQVKPGDPDNSTVVKVQKAGGHPGMFSDDELQRVINWIKTGAPQQ